MSNNLRYLYHLSPLHQLARQATALELVWPLPLIAAGVLRVTEPGLVGLVVVLALLPWGGRWLVLGKLTRRVFIGSAVTLLIISALIGTWASYDLTLSGPLLLTLLGSVSLFFAIANTPLSPRQVASGLVIIASLFALYFVGQYDHFNYRGESGRLTDLGRLTGSLLPDLIFFTPHPNAAAGFLESVWLLSLVLTSRVRGIERLAWGLTVGFITYGLLISQSRGAWVGLVIAIGIWALLLLPNRTWRLIVCSLGLVTGGIGLYSIWQMALSTSLGPALTSLLATADSRLILYRNSLYLWGDYLFTGFGLGDTFALVYSRYQLLIPVPFLTYSHNLFLSVGSSLGLLGLVALIWLLLNFYYFVFRVETKGDLNSNSWPFFRAAWLGATVTFVHGLTDAPQFAGSGWTMPMLFAVLGATISMGRPDLKEAWLQGKKARWGGRIGAVVVVLGIVAIFWQPMLSAWYANLGAIHQTRAELSPGLSDAAREAEAKLAVANFAQALNLNPVQPVANRRMGLMALERQNFETAITYLEQAYPQGSGNQATLKALGLVYLWTGRLAAAEELLRQVDDQRELIEELGNWQGWWSSQGRAELSTYASQMVQRLKANS